MLFTPPFLDEFFGRGVILAVLLMVWRTDLGSTLGTALGRTLGPALSVGALGSTLAVAGVGIGRALGIVRCLGTVGPSREVDPIELNEPNSVLGIITASNVSPPRPRQSF